MRYDFGMLVQGKLR